ncbi:tetratricopeptide repeat protein [Paraburkholderia sp. BL6669N2]|uniref:tetratricopeptide repeat protein n=1 Tax=Paraburkholderia sp. BL6669N2 TaxID=1938807 RepID=UPI000E36C5DE|nr:tetratricopeptide repeat protein [Paraburkholderia sp. BL6669N2]REG45543.1 tetratricopeptide repeat protein [Paraburkholderia sp. BL6669N2]
MNVQNLRNIIFGIALAALVGSGWAQSGSESDVPQFQDQIKILYEAGQFRDAISIAQKILTIVEHKFGPDRPETAESLSVLGNLYELSGLYPEAEPVFKRALAINEAILGPEHPATATSLNNLAALYVATGEYAKAKPLFERALAIDEKVLGPEAYNTSSDLIICRLCI